MNTVANLHNTIGGRLTAGTDPDRIASATPLGPVATDSRQVASGDVFWGLVGAHRDGADFAAEAFARGARGAVVGRPVEAPADRWVLVVDDTTAALQAWARHCRTRFDGVVIAVTGSAGKTTTRQMIDTVLRRRLTGTASPKNYNNHLGVPLSLLRIEPPHDYAVVELGASARGEIARLAELCRPVVGAVTNVGDAHLGGFGGRAAIAESKAELLEALPPDGHAVLGDDVWLRRMAGRCPAPITWVGRGADCHLAASDVHWSRGNLRFRIGSCGFRIPVWGRHHLTSALIAAAVGQFMGFELPEIAAALEDFVPVAMRCEVREVCGVTLINDAYNANPTAMRAALDLLRDVDAPGRRIVVCGDMAGLGDESRSIHGRLGRCVVTRCGADLLLACGEFAPDVVAGAREAGMPADAARALPTADHVLAELGPTIRPGDAVLVKGSRKMALEHLVEALDQRLRLGRPRSPGVVPATPIERKSTPNQTTAPAAA